MRLRVSMAIIVMAVLSACTEAVTLAPYPGETWTDAAAEPVPVDVVALYATDCPAWQGVGFLDLVYPPDGSTGGEVRRYARDPEGSLPTVELLAPYDANSALSSDARFTGYTTDRFMLFIGSDHEIYAYLVDGPRVEALPRAEDTLRCP